MSVTFCMRVAVCVSAFVLDTSKYQAAFGAADTPLKAAIAATVAWYRPRPGTS